MPLLNRRSNITLSGQDLDLGAVEIKDHDSDVRANVTTAGVAVDDRFAPLYAGESAWTDIGGTERRLDLTTLAAIHTYPMLVELEAEDAPCWVYQGDSTVVLPSQPRARIQTDGYRLITVSGVDEAYVAVQRLDDCVVSGTLIATRLDVLGP